MKPNPRRTGSARILALACGLAGLEITGHARFLEMAGFLLVPCAPSAELRYRPDADTRFGARVE